CRPARRSAHQPDGRFVEGHPEADLARRHRLCRRVRLPALCHQGTPRGLPGRRTEGRRSPQGPGRTSQPTHGVPRYTTGARINHWITAASLILLALSGMALFHPSLFFLTNLFGGGQMTRAIHPWIGVVLAISFLGLFFRFFTLNLWKPEDTVWMK